MKPYIMAAVTGLILTSSAFGESAHKGWRATPDRWPPASGGERGFGPKDRGWLYQPIPIRDFSMQGPFVRVDKPDPPATAVFKAAYWFKRDCTVAVQRVYLLIPGEGGTIQTREIKTTPLSVRKKEIDKGYYTASFNTEEVSFQEGDTFVVVFSINGKTTMVFLRILYCPLEPS